MVTQRITSTANTNVKRIVRLRDHSQRAKEGVTIIEGVRELARALEAGVVFTEIYTCDDLLKAWNISEKVAPGGNFLTADGLVEKLSSLKVPVYETTKAVFSKISYGDRSEGILGVCAPPSLSFEDISLKKHPVIVVVEAVEKPGNLGAIMRTCDGAGVDGVIVCDEKTDVYNPNVIRASLGTVFSLPVVAGSNEETLRYLQKKNFKICATLPKAHTVYTQADLKGSVAVIVGSEQNGLTDFWVKHAGIKVRIPMRGRADSLNVSASTAILLYEIIRQQTN